MLASSKTPPAVRVVNAIVSEGIRHHASDIHIEPRSKYVLVRLRIDGLLRDKMQIPDSVHAGTVSRLKVMAGLDIAERRKPQDGRVTVRTIKGIYDLRLSVIPTINGEKVVMRLLDRNGAVKRLDNLGLDEVDFESLRLIVRRPQGIILATGPTGSGKTTMLHSLVREGLSPSQNCVTIEYPVEYYLDTAGQVPVRDKIGLTFASILRAILRQDPDIIILGEIRDFETAEVAFHAANTGHLVLSTLHTNSAVASVVRLLDFGLKPYIVAEALEAVVAQRLLRRLCAKCREPDPGSEAERVQVGIKSVPASGEIFKAKGCAECGGGGYVGRTGVYELLLIRDEVRQLVDCNIEIGTSFGYHRACLSTDDSLLRPMNAANSNGVRVRERCHPKTFGVRDSYFVWRRENPIRRSRKPSGAIGATSVDGKSASKKTDCRDCTRDMLVKLRRNERRNSRLEFWSGHDESHLTARAIGAPESLRNTSVSIT